MKARGLVGALLGAALLLLSLAAQAAASCAPDRVDLRGPWGQARFTAEVVDTPRNPRPRVDVS